MSRRVVAITILLAWFGALGWLFARRANEPDRLGGSVRRLGPGSAWYAFELAGVPVGSAGLTIDTLTTGFTFLEVYGLDGVGRSELDGRQTLRLESTLSRTFRLLVASVSANQAGTPVIIDLAASTDSMAVLRQAIPGEPRRAIERLAVSKGILPAAITFRLGVEGRLGPGGVVGLWGLDPVRAVADTVTGRVTRDSLFILTDSATVDTLTGVWTPVVTDTVRAWRVEFGAPAREVRWVTDEGWPVLIEHPFGATIRRNAFELVENAYDRSRRLEEIPRLISPAGLHTVTDLGLTLVHDTAERRLLLARLDGRTVPGASAILAGGRQAAEGDTLVIRPGGVAGEEPPPWQQRHTGGVTATERTLLSQALSLALQRYGNAADTVTAITLWVARDLLKDHTVSAPVSAAEAVTAKRGGPEGKARLAVALARMAGYPARIVSGILVSDPRLPSHTWAEVWTDRWVAVDPTFGQVPASTALLRVMEGPARTVPMLTAVGALRVVTADPRRDRPR